MKKGTFAAVLIVLVALCALAYADGWVESWYDGLPDSDYYTSHAGWYNSYTDAYNGSRWDEVKVISRNASIWGSAKTGSSRIASVNNGEILEVVLNEDYRPTKKNGFYYVDYDGRRGWINQDYVAYAPLEIVLMEGNVPAYCAPTKESKRVGSLDKLTRYTVIGFYYDFYIINLRNAAAYVPMSVQCYDSNFEQQMYEVNYGGVSGQITRKTKVRTGPDDRYNEAGTLNGGRNVRVYGRISDWYAIGFEVGSDEVIAYVSVYDVQLDGVLGNG